MNQPLDGTRLALVEAAGSLFAEHGLEGTSIRAIAERAKANVAAVNYHFGSKENLYTEVLRHVATRAMRRPVAEYRAEAEATQSRCELSRLMADFMSDWFHSYFPPEGSAWHVRLMMRTLLEPSPSLQQLVDQVFRPDHSELEALLRAVCPGITEEQARFCAFTLSAQIAFFIMAKVPILLFLRMQDYDPAFLSSACEHVTQVVFATLREYGSPLTLPAT